MASIIFINIINIFIIVSFLITLSIRKGMNSIKRQNVQNDFKVIRSFHKRNDIIKLPCLSDFPCPVSHNRTHIKINRYVLFILTFIVEMLK